MVKNPSANARDAGDAGSIPGLRRSPGGGNGNPLQYSCWESRMDRGAWRATVHGVAKNQPQLSTHVHTHSAVYCTETGLEGCSGTRSVMTQVRESERRQAANLGDTYRPV